jgi:hypothetical protein
VQRIEIRSLEASEQKREQLMSKSSRRIIAAVVVLALHTLSLEAQIRPGPPLRFPGSQKLLPPLNAEINTTYTLADGSEFSSPGRYYRSYEGKVREDSPDGAIITDIKTGTVTVLNFETKVARVVKVPALPEASTPTSLPSVMPLEEATATVDGRLVTKKRFQNAQGESQEFWTAKDLGLVVFSKITSPSLTTAKSFRNISVGEPDPSVFRVPSDYTIMTVDAATGFPRP